LLKVLFDLVYPLRRQPQGSVWGVFGGRGPGDGVSPGGQTAGPPKQQVR